MNHIPKLKELLVSENFRTRTGMYIGANDINLLNSFISGVQYTLDVYQIEEEWLLQGFHEWVANYYQWNYSAAGWKNIILKECNGDARQAIDEFFRLHDLFRAEIEHTID